MRLFIGFLIVIIVGIVSGIGYKFFLDQNILKQQEKIVPTPIQEVPRSSGFQTEGDLQTGGNTSLIPTPTLNLPTVTITTRSDKRAITLTMQNLKNISALEYTVTYITKGIEKGIHGSIRPKSTDIFVSREILLGTCSTNTCVYDEGLSGINVSVTYTFADNTMTTVEKTHIL